MEETNQLLLNYYKKEEMKKIKEMMEEKYPIKIILENVNMRYITKEEVLERIGEDYEELIEESNVVESYNNIDIPNTSNVTSNTPMEIAKQYEIYFKEYKKDRKLICKSKNICNGTFQKYLRLNYLIPGLQELINKKKISLSTAEHISFLDKRNQIILFKIIEDCNYKISESIAKRIKRDYRKYKDYILSKEKVENYKNEKSFKIIFTQEEMQKYFKGIPNKEIKEYIISILEDTQDV